MAIANSTADEQQPKVERLSCSSDLTAGLHAHLIFISVFNSFLSLTAFLGNALILLALHKESSLHPPSKLLLRCLATTDLYVGLMTQPLFVTVWMSMHGERTLEYLCLRGRCRLQNIFYFDWSLSVDKDCNKRGQTSRPVVGTEIQTSCNFKANLPHRYCILYVCM